MLVQSRLLTKMDTVLCRLTRASSHRRLGPDWPPTPDVNVSKLPMAMILDRAPGGDNELNPRLSAFVPLVGTSVTTMFTGSCLFNGAAINQPLSFFRRILRRAKRLHLASV